MRTGGSGMMPKKNKETWKEISVESISEVETISSSSPKIIDSKTEELISETESPELKKIPEKIPASPKKVGRKKKLAVVEPEFNSVLPDSVWDKTLTNFSELIVKKFGSHWKYTKLEIENIRDSIKLVEKKYLPEILGSDDPLIGLGLVLLATTIPKYFAHRMKKNKVIPDVETRPLGAG